MDGVIAISNAVFNSLINVENIDPRKVAVVHYGIPDIVRPMTLVNKEENVNNEFRFISVARLEPQKRIPDLLKSFNIVKKVIPQATLHIFGEGSDRKKHLKLISEMDLEDSIFMPGRVENVFQELKKSHVFVLASEYEGFGLVYLEAILMDIPIVSSNNEAALEILGEGNFLGFNIGEVSNLADAMFDIYKGWGVIDLELKKDYPKLINKYSVEAMYEGTALAYKRFSKQRFD